MPTHKWCWRRDRNCLEYPNPLSKVDQDCLSTLLGLASDGGDRNSRKCHFTDYEIVTLRVPPSNQFPSCPLVNTFSPEGALQIKALDACGLQLASLPEGGFKVVQVEDLNILPDQYIFLSRESVTEKENSKDVPDDYIVRLYVDGTDANDMEFALNWVGYRDLHAHAAIFGRKPSELSPVRGHMVLAANNFLACRPFTASEAVEVAGRIVLVGRGDCNFYQKAQHTHSAGALLTIIVNVDSTLVTMTSEEKKAMQIMAPFLVTRDHGHLLMHMCRDLGTVEVSVMSPKFTSQWSDDLVNVLSFYDQPIWNIKLVGTVVRPTLAQVKSMETKILPSFRPGRSLDCLWRCSLYQGPNRCCR
jgi:hypothetical protein